MWSYFPVKQESRSSKLFLVRLGGTLILLQFLSYCELTCWQQIKDTRDSNYAIFASFPNMYSVNFSKLLFLIIFLEIHTLLLSNFLLILNVWDFFNSLLSLTLFLDKIFCDKHFKIMYFVITLRNLKIKSWLLFATKSLKFEKLAFPLWADFQQNLDIQLYI